MRRLLALVAVTSALAAAAPAMAQGARPVNVELDGATRVQLRGAASSVVIGNPNIADVTVVDASTLFITGRGYGVTEVVAVDAIGRTLFQSAVVVSPAQSGQVRVWRGGQVTEMACGASCAPTVRAGDAGPSATP